MPADGAPSGPGVTGLAAIGLAVCCGLPVLLSVAAGVTIAGVGLRSWLLATIGLVAVTAAAVWGHRRRNRGDVPADRPWQG